MELLSYDNLSPEQKYAFNKFVRGENLFITGAGGVGKSQLIKSLVQHANNVGKKIQVCALTGTAAVLLNMKAKTIHSWSGIKIAMGTKDAIIKKAINNRTTLSNWRTTKILIIDEVSMMSLKIFDILEEIARITRKGLSRPFGGMQVIFSGDFYQLPPVGNPLEPETGQFCFESAKWFDVFPPENHIELKTMFRQLDPLYCSILNQVRVGELTEEGSRVLQGRVGVVKPEGEIITRIFPIKKKVELINKYSFTQLPDKEYTFSHTVKTDLRFYIDSMIPIESVVLDMCLHLTSTEVEVETTRLLSGIPTDEVVHLKKGAVVMLTYNMCTDDGLCNGSQGVIIDILEKRSIPKSEVFGGLGDVVITVPVVRFTNGLERQVPPHFWQSEEYPTIGVGQYPLILAYALTIHKIQGATLNRAEIDLGGSIFEYGQSYVGLSRVRSLDGLYLTAFHSHRIKANPLVRQFYDSIPPISHNDLKMPEWCPLAVEETCSSIVPLNPDISLNIPVAVAVPITNTTTRTVDFSAYRYVDSSAIRIVKKV